jgi:uncharacterized phiE125 gp8 family phage protein
MQITVVTDSAEAPVTLAEVKQWLKIDHTEDDAKLTELIESAVNTIENYINNPIITKTVLYVTDNYIIDGNGDVVLYLPYIPSALDFVRVYDIDDTATTITAYNRYTRKIVFTEYPTLTVRLNAGYQVQFDAGIASNASTTPADIKTVVKEIVAYFYDNCCDRNLGQILQSISGYINFFHLTYQ